MFLTSFYKLVLTLQQWTRKQWMKSLEKKKARSSQVIIFSWACHFAILINSIGALVFLSSQDPWTNTTLKLFSPNFSTLNKSRKKNLCCCFIWILHCKFRLTTLEVKRHLVFQVLRSQSKESWWPCHVSFINQLHDYLSNSGVRGSAPTGKTSHSSDGDSTTVLNNF